MNIRKQIFQESDNDSLLWGAWKTGKSTLLKELFLDAFWFDLLLTDVFKYLQSNLAQLRSINN